MGKIPDNFIQVPENSATSIPMDIDVMVRKTIIYLYDVMNKQNTATLQPYDDYYFQLPKDKGIMINKDEPGAANIFYPVYYNTCATINMLISNFIALIKPIEISLQLPELLLNPPKLLKTVKKIIDLIMKLIAEIIKMISDTKNWFIEKFLGIFKNIKLPKEIGELYDYLVKHIDLIIDGILAIILAAKNDAILMMNKLISTLNKQLKNLEDELKKLIENDLSESLRKRNEIILNFLPQFNESSKYTLDKKWLDSLDKNANITIDSNLFIDSKWNEMLKDKNNILDELKKLLSDEEKSLTKIDKNTNPTDYKEEEQEIKKLKKTILNWENDIKYDIDTTFNITTKLNRLVVERQKIIEYYLNKKSVLDKIKKELTIKLNEAKKKLKELKDKSAAKAKKMAAAANAKIEVINAYVKTIIEVILFPFKVIGTVIKNLIKAITGFLENIPNLSKMIEGVLKLVKSIKDLLDPTKILNFITDICIEVFDAIKPGLGKVLKWMKKNGGLLMKNLDKAIAWCKKNVPEIIEFILGFLGLIVRIIGLIPMMIQTILMTYINYAFKSVPSPVKSVIGLT